MVRSVFDVSKVFMHLPYIKSCTHTWKDWYSIQGDSQTIVPIELMWTRILTLHLWAKCWVSINTSWTWLYSRYPEIRKAREPDKKVVSRKGLQRKTSLSDCLLWERKRADQKLFSRNTSKRKTSSLNPLLQEKKGTDQESFSWNTLQHKHSRGFLAELCAASAGASVYCEIRRALELLCARGS